MSNNKDFKVKNGIQPTSYFEGVGTVVSGQAGYNLAGASYDSVSFTPSPAINSTGLAFKADGTKMYTLDLTSATVEQYSLSTAFDVSTATKDSKTFSVSSQDAEPYEITFKSDGTKLFVLGLASDSVYSYTLSTAWDVSTASYDSVSFSFASQTTQPYGMSFKSDGTSLYVMDYANNNILQYNLSTAWDASTLSYSSKSLAVGSESTRGYGLSLSPDGTKAFVGDDLADAVFEYTLSTAWDISTGAYSGNSLSVASQGQVATSIEFNSDGTKMITTGFRDDSIYQYSTVQTTAELDLSTGSVFEVTPTSDIQVTLSNPAASGTVSGATLLLEGGASSSYDIANAVYDDVSFSVAGQEDLPNDVFFKTDGTKMYVVGSRGDDVNEYDLSTAWDISTASYLQNFSVVSQANPPHSISFKTDGTKMYILSSTNVNEYNLSTAWDVSTSAFSQSFSVTTEETSALGVYFKLDGTKMYVVGSQNDELNEYDLSTAWDISTAVYSQNFSVSSQDSEPSNVDFNSDGTKMYVVGRTSEALYQYSLTSAFNLSTASYDSVSFSFSSQDANPTGIFFANGGTRMYMIGGTNDSVFQYSTATPATITYDTAIEWPSGTAPTSPAIGETDVITFNTRDGGSTYQGVLAIDGAK